MSCMKQFIIISISLFVFSSLITIAQSVNEMHVVGKAEYLSDEIVDSSLKNDKGNVCAGLVIETNLNGLSFNSSEGIIKISTYPGKILLFLSPEERVVKVYKTNFLPLIIDLSNYGIMLKSGEVFKLSITDLADSNLISVNFIISPNDATLYIDDEEREGNQVHSLSYGEHHLVISKNGFEVKFDTINVSYRSKDFVYELDKFFSNGNLDSENKEPHGFNTPKMIFVKGGNLVILKSEESSENVIVNDFHIGQFEVTFEEYDLFCESTGRDKPSSSGWGRVKRPVININWDAAAAYCKWLSDNSGKKYRLPTEVEWEYAAKGGQLSQEYEYSGGDKIGDVCWYWLNNGKETKEVGTKLPNQLGIFDMTGNVWEWCSDWYTEIFNQSGKHQTSMPKEFRVIRGGSWYSYNDDCRVENRNKVEPDHSDDDLGFRVVAEVK